MIYSGYVLGRQEILNTWHLRRDFDSDMNKTAEELIEQLKVKLKLLAFTAAKTDSTIAKADVEVSDRLCSSIKNIIKGVSDVKEAIEESKFKSGASVQDVQTWGDEIEKQIEYADDQVRKLAKQVRDINKGSRRLKTRKRKPLNWNSNGLK